MYIETWMLVVIAVWWLASVFSISQREKLKGHSLGVEFTINYMIRKYDLKQLSRERILRDLEKDFIGE